MPFGRIDMINDYSQNKLYDYLECPRRFELRYLLKRIWPAVHSEPVLEMERYINNGKNFHLMAHQFFIGIDSKDIIIQIDNEDIREWWQNFVKYASVFLSQPHYSEVQVLTKINSHRFVGIFDFLVCSPGEKFIIIDWKTNHIKPEKKILEHHIQTRLYPLLLTLAGDQWNNNEKIQPHQIEMLYWFAIDPDNPEIFSYSQKQFQSDLQYIQELISAIENTRIGNFLLTSNEKKCKFCNYRSLCGRGTKPGDISELDNIDLAFLHEELDEIDISQIGEITF